MMVCTLQQSAAAQADNSDLQDYVAQVRAATDTKIYDELDAFIKALPDTLKAMKML